MKFVSLQLPLQDLSENFNDFAMNIATMISTTIATWCDTMVMIVMSHHNCNRAWNQYLNDHDNYDSIMATYLKICSAFGHWNALQAVEI